MQPASIDLCKGIRTIDPQIKYSLTPEFTVQFHPSKKKKKGKRRNRKTNVKEKAKNKKRG